ncbi:hypothetical protein [Psychrobacter sp. UBA6291]|uniref:hypothetical protein n=1 Tax=Psychrobacter sp. UBA6291 TaxID=1947357 RepID=UPI0025808A68|nr:hypothetical protein [Psychrobacter sp. UBA6291]
MSKVYQKLGLFGKTYWYDDGLFVKRITKHEYDEIVIKSQVAKELARQQDRSARNAK